MADCSIFVIVVLSVTAIWVYYGRNFSFSFLANAMFFPALFSLLFVDSFTDFITTASGINEISRSVFYSCVAILAVYILVYGCVAFGVVMSWTFRVNTSDKPNNQAVHKHNAIPIMGFLRAAGEEIGWRCFMLPCLLSVYTTPMALFISGTVWGLYHVPVMILLTRKLKVPNTYRTVLVQSVSCLLMAYPIGWLAIKSKHSLWACSIMHWMWNRINPKVLGSIYTQTPGIYTGEQWKINGEGLAGCIVMFPVALLCLYDLGLT